MPEVKEKYANLKEREIKVKKWEDQKYRMLHDNFDPDWKSGDEPHGTLVFTDAPTLSQPVIDWKSRWQSVQSTPDRWDLIAEYLGWK